MLSEAERAKQRAAERAWRFARIAREARREARLARERAEPISAERFLSVYCERCAHRACENCPWI